MKNEAREVSAILDIDLAFAHVDKSWHVKKIWTRDPKQCGGVGG